MARKSMGNCNLGLFHPEISGELTPIMHIVVTWG